MRARWRQTCYCRSLLQVCLCCVCVWFAQSSAEVERGVFVVGVWRGRANGSFSSLDWNGTPNHHHQQQGGGVGRDMQWSPAASAAAVAAVDVAAVAAAAYPAVYPSIEGGVAAAPAELTAASSLPSGASPPPSPRHTLCCWWWWLGYASAALFCQEPASPGRWSLCLFYAPGCYYRPSRVSGAATLPPSPYALQRNNTPTDPSRTGERVWWWFCSCFYGRCCCCCYCFRFGCYGGTGERVYIF